MLTLPAWGQVAFIYGRGMGVNQFNPQGGFIPISYGPVRVCATPASGSPCFPTAEANGTPITDIFGNTLSVVGGNFGQLTTDVAGNFNFGCTVSGNYLIQIATSTTNTPQLNYIVTCGGASSGGGGGGGGSGITGLTQGVVPQAGSATTIINTAPQLDNALTLPNALTYKGAAGFNLPSDNVHAGSIQLGGNNILPSLLPSNTFGFVGPPTNSFSSYFLQPGAAGPTNANPFMSCATPVANVSTCTWAAAPTGFPTAQIGDTYRFNTAGDGVVDAVNMSQSVEGIFAVNQSASLTINSSFGVSTTTAILGGSSDLAPTATSQSGKIITSSAVASTSTNIGMDYGRNGNVSLMGMLAFYRWTFKFSIGNTTNARYWMGLGCYNNTGTGNNNIAFGSTSSTAYASDSPNKSTIGFRFSASTDTHWQAVADTAGGSQTTVDTGVTPDTSVHLFEMTTNAAGSSVFYWIDGNLVATISTNLPPPANNGNSWGSRFFTGDNKNTATAISFTFYYMLTSFK